MTIFGASSLHPKFPFPAAVVELKVDRSTPGIPTFEPPYFGTLGRRCSYSGLSPSASNCLTEGAFMAEPLLSIDPPCPGDQRTAVRSTLFRRWRMLPCRRPNTRGPFH